MNVEHKRNFKPESRDNSIRKSGGYLNMDAEWPVDSAAALYSANTSLTREHIMMHHPQSPKVHVHGLYYHLRVVACPMFPVLNQLDAKALEVQRYTICVGQADIKHNIL
jgi:hypothetical protein